MKHKKNILMIIIALILVLALASCGQKTENAVDDDNIEKSEEPMETTVPHDDDSTEDESNEDSMEEDEDNDSIGNEDSDEDTMDDEDTAELKVFTLEELSSYNGLDGSPAYVAVEGLVYDFTNLGAWRNGKHNGFTAGKDLTDEIINASPHGVKNLEGVPIVGSLAEK